MKKLDIVIIISVLLLSLISFSFCTNREACEVLVEIAGKTYATYSINDDRVVSIETEYGNNLLVIENKEVFITNSSCKDKLEIKAGKISKTGQSLVCLPNKLVVTLKGDLRTIVNTY